MKMVMALIHQIKAVEDARIVLSSFRQRFALDSQGRMAPKMERQTENRGDGHPIPWQGVNEREVNRDAAAACADYFCSRHAAGRARARAHCSWAAIRLGSFLVSAGLGLCVWSFPPRAHRGVG